MASGRTWCPAGSSRKNKTKNNKIEQNMLPIRDQHPHVKGFAAESHGTLAGHPNVEDHFSYQAPSTQARTEIPHGRGYAVFASRDEWQHENPWKKNTGDNVSNAKPNFRVQGGRFHNDQGYDRGGTGGGTGVPSRSLPGTGHSGE